VDGLILRIEFLLSTSNSQPKTVLALLISKGDATHLLLYSWEQNAPLRYAKLEGCGPHRLPDRDRMPLLMIPSNHNASFTLVTESGLTVYDDVLSTKYRRINMDLAQTFPPNFVGSRRSPLWVQWAKPYRHSEYLKTNDDFYLVREDGQLRYFEIIHNTPSKVQYGDIVGSLDIGVDSAFAILEGPVGQGGDICVIGGDMTDGAVCHMMAREHPQRLQTITNLAPLRDMLVMENTGREDAQRIFVCSGKGEGHAAVAEIRHGLEARIGFLAEQEDSSVATGVWILPEIFWDHLTMLVSYPMQTSVLRINFEKSSLTIADDDLDYRGLQLNSTTLAFGIIEGNLLVQITPSAVIILSPLSKMKSVERKHESLPISIGTIYPDNMLIATITMVNDEFQVLLSCVLAEDGVVSIIDHSEAYSMVEEPSSILIVDHNGTQLLFVGTVTGGIHVLAIGPDQRMCLLSRISIATLFPLVQASALCSLAFLTNTSLRLPALACGTRNGWLLGISIVPGLAQIQTEERSSQPIRGRQSELPKRPILQAQSSQHIGQTSVKLMPDPENRSTALVFCDFDVHRLVYSQASLAATFEFSRVWFTNVAQVCLLL
jgi:Mono-functional DNA-alkylating methyl methanesulfonate N-term